MEREGDEWFGDVSGGGKVGIEGRRLEVEREGDESGGEVGIEGKK